MTFNVLIPPAFVNVAQYGASPSNTAAQNDTAIANAIAALPSNGPGTLLFPCIGTGIYKISQSIIVDKDNIALVAFGRVGTVTIQIDASVDPTWALIVGNTKNVQNCAISGLGFQGKNSSTSTGGGILFRANEGSIKQVYVTQFGGSGISLNAFSGTLFEMHLDDVLLIKNGMNSTTPGDNLLINNVSDSEYHRIISAGNSTKNTTRYGINNTGGNHKFVNCHCYWAAQAGFENTGANVQVIGGEYETNGTYGIENGGTTFTVSQAACFGNTNSDINSYNSASITETMCSSACFQNIYVNSANGGVIGNNLLSGAQNAIVLDTGAAGYSVHDNKCSSTTSDTIFTRGTNSSIHDNVLTGGGITESGAANNNDIHDNSIPSGKTITLVGTGTKVRNNPGYNPRGHSVTQPGVPASTVAVTNTTGCDCMVLIAGGTLTAIIIGGSATGITAAAAAGSVHSVRVPVGQTIAITYSVAPTWQWFGD